MKEIRFIHAADLHLDTPFKGFIHLPEQILKQIKESTFRAFEKVANIAIKEKCDFLIIAGDLYDGANRSLQAQIFLKKQCERLKQHDIAVFICHGNHDHLSGKWLKIEWPENVHFFAEKVECKKFVTRAEVIVHLYGFSYSKREIYENMSLQYEKKEDAHFHIGILHGQAEGVSGHEPYAPFQVSDLEKKEFDYWALGHIHKYMKLKENIFYPGNIQGRHLKETGEKGCLLVHLKEGFSEIKFIPTAEIIWEVKNLSIKDIESIDDLRMRIEELIERERKEYPVLLQINFIDSGKLSSFLADKEDVNELISSINEEEVLNDAFVWIVHFQNQTSQMTDISSLKEKDHFLGDIVRISESYRYHEQKEIFNDLFKHRRAKRFLSPFTEEDFAQIKKEAEMRVISELLEEWES